MTPSDTEARMREILAEELDAVKLHHSACRIRGEINDGHLMTIEGLEACLAAMLRARNEAIEEAAKIAAEMNSHGQFIAAAIRQLKDKTDG